MQTIRVALKSAQNDREPTQSASRPRRSAVGGPDQPRIGMVSRDCAKALMDMCDKPMTEANLAALIIDDPEFRVLDRAFDVFCPFEAMNAARVELRHSAFLATLLDPLGTHGFGDACLRALMDLTVEASDDPALSRLNLHMAELGDAEIRREWRSIDVLAIMPSAKMVLCVEVKVEASEHSDQLARYRETVEAAWPGPDWTRLFVFLTAQGIKPSDSGWAALPFAMLTQRFAVLVQQGGGIEMARAMLNAYVNMIRRRYVADNDLTEMARLLWQRHTAALEFLVDNRPDPTGELMSALREEFNEIRRGVLRECDRELMLDHCSKGYVRFAVPVWDSVPGMLLGDGWTPSKRLVLFEVVGSRNSFYVKIVLGQGDLNAREDIHNKIVDAPDAVIQRRKTFSPKYQTLVSRKINVDAEKEGEFAEKLAKLRDETVRFISEHLPVLDSALRAD